MKPVPAPAEEVDRASAKHVALLLGTLDGGRTEVHTGGHASPASDAVLQIGSITKTFTALALARAVVRGDLRLDHTVGALLPEGTPLAPGLAEVTLLELATHTSGLPRLPPGSWRKVLRRDPDPYADITTSVLMEALVGVRLRRRPSPTYSNLGFGLLGTLLAQAADMSYAELVAREVTGPLGLADTVVEPGEGQRPRLLTGHTRRLRPVEVAWSFEAMAGAGALWSTVSDLLRYAAAHLEPPDGELGEAIGLATRQHTTGRGATHGLAWLVLPAYTRIEGVFHNGGTRGYRSALVVEPPTGRAAVALTNCDRSVDSLAIRAVLAAGQASADTGSAAT